MLGRGDHFEMKFIVKCCKFIHMYGLPKSYVGPSYPQIPPLLPTQPAQFTGMGYVGRSGGTWGSVGPKI